MERIHVYIWASQLKTLRAIARKKGCTVAELIRRAIDLLLKREWRDAR